MRIVLIGHGYWGKNIARNLDIAGVLYGVCETDSEVCSVVSELYPGIRLYHSAEHVFADTMVDAVVISTQAGTHVNLALGALTAGKDVFVEKPLALNYNAGLKVVQTAEALDRVLMVGHLLEYHPAILKLIDLVRGGVLGDLQYLYSNRLNLGRFRREENILWSFAPHDIAVVLSIVGEVPIEVLATGGAYLQPNVADTTVTNMLFSNGIRAHIFVSWLHPYKEQRLIVVGSKKMAVFDDRAVPDEKFILYDVGANWVNNTLVPRQGGGMPIEFDRTEPLRLEIEHFIHCIESRQQPKTDGRSALRVLQVLQAAQQSLLTGGIRVPLWQPIHNGVAL